MNQARNKWYSIACDYIYRPGPFSDQVPVFAPPARPRDFRMLESLWGVELPEEFVSFYSFSNGFGARTEDDNSIWWEFLPIEQLPQFTRFERDFFCESHPHIASCFMPFITFSPDAGGYFSQNGKVTEQIWYFEDGSRCALVSKAPDYDWRYFLSERESSIEEYLRR